MNNFPTDFSTVATFFQTQGVQANWIEGEKTGWRMRAKLAVRGTKGHPQIGLFKEGTHEVIPLLDCPDHHPSINVALQYIYAALIQLGIVPYDEKTLKGDLRYVQLTVEKSTGRIQLTLVANGQQAEAILLRLIDCLIKETLWHSIWINIQEGSTNTIFGRTWKLIYGEEELWQELCEKRVCFHPSCFTQANLALFEQVLKVIEERVLPNKTVLELYAGVGAIGLIISSKSHSVTLIESSPECIHCFQKSSNFISHKNLTFFVGDVKNYTACLEKAEVLIVDPPRKGIEAHLMEKVLAQTGLQQLIYLSCSADTFLRDAQKLLQAGWKAKVAQGYLFFPGTRHIEILAAFERSG